MAKTRKQVTALSKTQLSPAGSGAPANLPTLKSTTPSTATNQMMKAFAGFNSTIQQIGVAREKNAAAAEQVAAKNAALLGEFKVFDRADSVNAYHEQLGNINGRRDSVLFKQDIEKLNISILNSGVDAATAAQMYTDGYGKLAKQRFGKAGNGAFEHESEFYKSGYIPHQIKTIEDGRVALLASHREKFVNETLSSLSESAKNYLDDFELTAKFNKENPDSSGTVSADPTFNIDVFSQLEKEGVNLGLEKRQIREHLVNFFVQEAVERKDEDILDFVKQRLPDGTLIENDLKLNKIIDAGYVQAANARIAEDVEERRKQKLILETNQRVSRRGVYQFSIANPDDPIEAKEAAQTAADLYDWTPEQLASSLSFIEATSGDRAITWNPAEEDVVTRGILSGNITSSQEIQDIYMQSRYDGTGINLAAVGRLEKHLDDVNANGNKASAFQRNKDALLRKYGLSNDSVMIVGKDGDPEFIKERERIAGIIENFDNGLNYWMNQNAEDGTTTASLWSPEANKFFDDLKDAVELAAQPKVTGIEPGEKDFEQPPMVNHDKGNSELQSDLKKLAAFGKKQYKGRKLNKKIDAARKYLKDINKFNTGEY